MDKNKKFKKAINDNNIELVKLLLKDPNVDPSTDYNYGICYASEDGYQEIVELLLKDPRIDPSARENKALCLACENGYIEIVKLLLNDSRLYSSESLETAFFVCSLYGYVEILDLLFKEKRFIRNKISDIDDCLIYASEKGHIKIVELLLSNNINPVIGSNSAIKEAYKNNNLLIVKKLWNIKEVKEKLETEDKELYNELKKRYK